MELDDKIDPIALFNEWFSQAEKQEPKLHNAMQLATVSRTGMPSIRTVLLKNIIDGAFIFHTNYESRKGKQLFDTGKASICFHWKSLDRQVIISGTVRSTSATISDDYFKTRSRNSNIGAWASLQSQPLDSRQTLVDRYHEFQDSFGDTVPRPPHWGGIALEPLEFEFWQDGEFRLHDRFKMKPIKESALWEVTRYYP